MPGSYLIDPAQSLVFSRGWGVLTDATIWPEREPDAVFGAAARR